MGGTVVSLGRTPATAALLGGASLALLLAAAVACDDAKKPTFLPEASPTVTAEATATAQPTPSPSLTATAAPAPGSMESFRAFARQIEAAVNARDAGFFMGIATISTVVCPNEFESRCEGQPDGAQIEGVWFGRWRSEGSLLSKDGMGEAINTYLDSLADPALHAIGRRDGAGLVGEVSFFAVVVSAERPEESTYVFEFVHSNATWRFASVMEAPVLVEEWLSGGCSECYAEWERWEGTN
jgi:hypothetical protein